MHKKKIVIRATETADNRPCPGVVYQERLSNKLQQKSTFPREKRYLTNQRQQRQQLQYSTAISSKNLTLQNDFDFDFDIQSTSPIPGPAHQRSKEASHSRGKRTAAGTHTIRASYYLVRL